MNANWYDVLDVDPTSSPDEIRAAWRAAVAELDPTDRRFRVFSQAAEILLDPARRAAYDAELAAQGEETPPEDVRLEADQLEKAQGRGARLEKGRLDRAQDGKAQEAKAQDSDAQDTDAQDAAAPDASIEPTSTTGSVEPALPAAATTAGPGRTSLAERLRGGRVPLVPAWLVLLVAGLLAASLVGVGVLLSKPSDASVESDTQAAQSAAERAIVPVLSYDAHHLDQSQAAAEPFMTANEQQQYDKLFAVIKQNAPRTGTVVQAKYLASGIVRSGTDQVDVLVFVDQITRNKQHPKVPVVYKNQVTVTMAKVGGNWLVDNLTTNGTQG